MRRWNPGIALLLTVGLLTGCGGGEYERIDVEALATTEPVLYLESQIDLTIDSEEPETVMTLPENPEQAVTLLFGGDVLLSGHVLNAYEKGGIGGVLDTGYRSVIDDADFFMVNQEFPFSSRGIAAEDKQYTFRLPEEKVLMLQELGIDGVTLANNHALDFGTEGLLDSLVTLDGAGILHTGAGADLDQAKAPVIVEQDGIRIGILGATRVVPESTWIAGSHHAGMLSSYDTKVLLKEITDQKKICDYVIVYVHWGVEKDEMPQEYQRTLGQQYIDAGADLVIGSHPHVLQGVEYYKGKPILYSLGNFIFGSTIPKTTLVQVKLTDDQDMELFLLPGTSGAGYTRMLTEDGKVQEFYQHIESLSFNVTITTGGKILPKD